MLRSDRLLVLTAVLAPVFVSLASTAPPEPTAALTRDARDFLAALPSEQRAAALFPFEDAERTNWHFVPGRYPGVEFGALDLDGRRRAHALLRTAFGRAGYLEATAIFRLEQVLRDLARSRGQDAPHRDPERYSLGIFGQPGDGPWALRIQGHHLSCNWTILPTGVVTVTPRFVGANPHEVREGPFAGLRVLGDHEDAGREVLAGLTAEQREAVMLATEAPADVLLTPGRSADLLGEPRGIAATDLQPAARAALRRLLDLSIEGSAPSIAAQVHARMDLDTAFFGWMGSTEPGQPHYFRVHGDGFVLEYDNTQNDANHSHLVLHDLRNGFGGDLLAEHLRADHRR